MLDQLIKNITDIEQIILRIEVVVLTLAITIVIKFLYLLKGPLSIKKEKIINTVLIVLTVTILILTILLLLAFIK